jgi:hypothetical protein
MKPPKPNLARIFLGEWKRLWTFRSRKEPSQTLDCLNILEDSSEYKTSARTDLLQINLANQLPLNQAAAQFLPPSWRDNLAELHVLSLMRWGLENGLEHWLEEMARIQKGPTPEQVEARINRLAQMEPKKAMQFLTDPENTGDVVLDAEELLNQETPEDAASLLLETLYANMVAIAP